MSKQKKTRYSKERRDAIATDDEQIIDLLKTLQERADEDSKIRNMGIVVERLCQGRPMNTLASVIPGVVKFDEPESPENIIGTTAAMWATLITGDRASPRAVATTPDLESKSAEMIANALIEYFQTEESLAKKWHRTAMYAAHHGTGFMKVYYDPADAQVHFAPLSIHQVFLQNAERKEDVNWCVIRSMLDEDTAMREVQLAKPDEECEDLPEESYEDSVGITRTGVAKYEIWYKPGAKYKTGLYAAIVGDVVVESMEYPYIIPNGPNPPRAVLPVVWWTARHNNGATLGTSPFFDLVATQNALNKINSKILKTATQSSAMLLLPKALRTPDYFDEDNLIITYDSLPAEQLTNIRWVNTSPLDPQWLNERSQLKEQMLASSGISESTLGNAAKDASGTSISYRAQLDKQRLAEPSLALESARRDAWEICLGLVQTFYEDSQLPVEGQDPIYFRGADLAGIKIKLDPSTENDQVESTKMDKIKQDVATGMIGPEALAEHQPTIETVGMRRIVETQLQEFLDGKDWSLTKNTAPPEVVLKVIDERIAKELVARNMENVQVLEGLKDNYIQDVAQQMVAEQKQDPSAAGAASQQPQQNPEAAPLPEVIEGI